MTTLLGKLAGVKEGSAAYNAIAGELAKAGVDVGSSTQSVGKSVGTPSYVSVDGVSGAAPKTKYFGSSGSTGKSAGMPYSNALSYAKGWKEQGMDANTIASRLMNLGASDDVIDRAMQNAGF